MSLQANQFLTPRFAALNSFVEPPFDSAAIIVVGDLILDEYLIGQATRLSREAAVPVLERTRRQLIAGGAANPAVGVVALGGRPLLAGVIGEDASAAALCKVLTQHGIKFDAVLSDSSRPTTTKTRIVAEGGFVYVQHLARIDYLDRRRLDIEIEKELLHRIRAFAVSSQVILVSDYKNGVVTPTLVQELIALRDAVGIPLVVDSQGDLERFRGFDLVKCNRAEAESYLGISIPVGEIEIRKNALDQLQQQIDARAVVVTLGSEGMAWQDKKGYGECQAPRADVYDVTGAGDTVIAMLALAYAAEFSLAEGCQLATHAAALTVRVMGNYAPTWREVIEQMQNVGVFHN